jgi:hypothetical protein
VARNFQDAQENVSGNGARLKLAHHAAPSHKRVKIHFSEIVLVIEAGKGP